MRLLAKIFILSLLILSCDKKKSEPKKESESIQKSFSNYKELPILRNYEKISDTSYQKHGFEPTHRITHLQLNKENLILFNRISLDEERRELYSILDTLRINQLHNNTFVTIGYCKLNDMLPEEIIAVVEKTEKDTIQKIIKAWRGNSESKKIEKIKDLNGITCLNEF